MFPEYIITKDFRILKFRRKIQDRDIAEYGRLNDMGTITWRGYYEIKNKTDLFYLGEK